MSSTQLLRCPGANACPYKVAAADGLSTPTSHFLVDDSCTPATKLTGAEAGTSRKGSSDMPALFYLTENAMKHLSTLALGVCLLLTASQSLGEKSKVSPGSKAQPIGGEK